MKRSAPAPELLTDFIPCLTPPVRDGDYDVFYTKKNSKKVIPKPFRAEFKNGQWYGIPDGRPRPGLNEDPQNFGWRGVRRWVLRAPPDNFATLISPKIVDVYLESARPRSTKWNALIKARPFKTEVAAQRFADGRKHLKLTVELP